MAGTISMGIRSGTVEEVMVAGGSTGAGDMVEVLAGPVEEEGAGEVLTVGFLYKCVKL
jgi:hypothetical protein